MISFALTVARKDLLLTFTRGSGLVQGLLLGLLLLFVFSLSQGVGERMSPQGAGAVFWLGSAFCQVLIFNTLYALEEANGARLGLLLAPAPIQAVWLGKALAGLLLLLWASARCCWWTWACALWVRCWARSRRAARRANPC